MARNYTYVIARIRALEAKMLAPIQVSRMIESPDLDRAFFVLGETTYADHISAAIHPFNYEDIIKAELTRIHNFLKYYAGDDERLLMLWRKYDYGNAKILIRASKKKLEEVESMLSEFGTVDNQKMISYFMKGEGFLPDWLERSTTEAIVAFEENGNPAEIDRVLDNAFFNGLIASGNSLLEKFAKLYTSIEFPVDLEGDNKAIDLLRGIKRQAFGIGPLITFWLAKELEVTTIRQLLIAKKHRLPTSLIKERIRSVYV